MTTYLHASLNDQTQSLLKHMFTKKSDINILDTSKCRISFVSNEYEKRPLNVMFREYQS